MQALAPKRWRLAAACALAVHLLLVGLAIRSVKILGAPPEPRAFDIALAPPLTAPTPRRVTSAPHGLTSPAAIPPTPVTPQPIPDQPEQAPAATAPSSDDAAGRVRALLRESVGCDSAELLKLTDAERRRCETRLAAQADGGPAIGPTADPARMAEYEASLRRRAVGQVMPPRGRPSWIVGKCGGAGGVFDSVKIGPCSIGIPGIFNDDDTPSH